MKERRDRIAQQVDESKESLKPMDIESETEKAVDCLWTIGEELLLYRALFVTRCPMLAPERAGTFRLFKTFMCDIVV